MDAYSRPLDRLYETMARFIRRPDRRVLRVEADEELRGPAVEMVMGLEYHADNRSPFVRVELPQGAEWGEAVREQHALRRELMAAQGYELPALVAGSAAEDERTRLGLALSQVLAARCAPLEGLVVVIAPTHVESAAALRADVDAWLATPPLAGARFVFIERAPSSIGPLDHELYERLELDQTAVREELERRLDAAAMAPLSAPGPAQVGAAWPPGEVPPSRTPRAPLDRATAATRAAELGVSPGLFGTEIREVRPLVLRAALALRDGDALKAVRFQQRAVERTHAAGLLREALLMEVVLATYIVHAGETTAGEETYRNCAQRGIDAGFHDIAAQALMAAGSLRLLGRDKSGASVAYAWAGRTAKEGEEVPLAVEGFRMAGQLAAEDGNHDVAGKLWTEALELVEDMPPEAAGQTSAPLAAEQLAEHFRRMGLDDQAASLDAQAAEMRG